MTEWDEYDDPVELAHALWEHVSSQDAIDLPPDRFRTLFARIYDKCRDVPTLWQLGGATNDYLRRHPDALTVPVDLPTTLLNSDDIEARVIGLKLLNRCNVADDAIVSHIIRAILRRDGYESRCGLCELHEFLDRREACGRQIGADLVQRLQQVLAAFREDDDNDIRSSADHLSDRLGRD